MDSYKICLLKPQQRFYDASQKELLKDIDFLPKMNSNLEINGNFYNVDYIDYKNKLVGVRQFSFIDEPEGLEEDDFTCPYCGYIDMDAFEFDDEGTRECGKCGSEIEYKRVIEIKYLTTPIKKKEPILLD